MTRSNDSALRADMSATPFTATERQGSRGYTLARSAATRPLLSLTAVRAARQSRALQLSWIGLVRR